MVRFFDRSIISYSMIKCKKTRIIQPRPNANKRRYVNFENGSHFICSFNLNNPETTVCIVLKIIGIVSGDQEIVNSLIGNSVIDNGKLKINAKHISFHKTHSGGLGLLISKAQSGSYVAIANDSSNFFPRTRS